MWFSKPKITKAADKWHSKAMLVDPKKTRITFLWAEAPVELENEENSGFEAINLEASIPNVIEKPNTLMSEEHLEEDESASQNGEQNLKPNDVNVEATGSDLAESDSSDAASDNLEIAESNSEVKAQNSIGSPCVRETAGNLEVFQPEIQNSSSNLAESENGWKSEEDIEVLKENVEMLELNLPEEANTIAPTDDLAAVDSNGGEDANTPETSENSYDFIFAEKEPLNIQFLRVLQKTRSKWCYDKKFAKIVQKMEKGKKLKRREFDKVYLHIHTYCQ